MRLDWIKKPYPIGGLYSPKYIWIAEDDLSFCRKLMTIIEPCQVSFGQYELYDGKETYRFDTLEEAQGYAETLAEPKPIPYES